MEFVVEFSPYHGFFAFNTKDLVAYEKFLGEVFLNEAE